MTEFSTNTTTGIAIDGTIVTNPVTIDAGVTISNTTSNLSGNAVQGDPGTAWNVFNYGTILSNSTTGYGIDLRSGGSVTNGASVGSAAQISGDFAAVNISGGSGAVGNFATLSGVSAGVELRAGGSVTNGAAGATTARISGGSFGLIINGGAGTVANFGRIAGIGGAGYGVALFAGGSVTNGQSGSSAGFISGKHEAVSIDGSAGTVDNFGTITSTSASGVGLSAGGSVTNGASGASAALITGYHGVVISGSAGTVGNLATIISTGTSGIGVELSVGGSVTNGASGVTAALIAGGEYGVAISVGSGTVSNFGTIIATETPGFGVDLTAGGRVTNGQSASSTGLISGSKTGVEVSGSAGTIANFGTITGGYRDGVDLEAGGSVSNGASAGSRARIAGAYYGVYVKGTTGAIVNFGTIQSTNHAFAGVSLRAGGSVNNASPTALIRGDAGVIIAGGAGTVTNLGTVSGGQFDGVFLVDGGILRNGTAGSISGFIGVVVGNAGTVIDSGIISGPDFGVDLTAGGSITIGRYGLVSGDLGISIAGGAGNLTVGGYVAGGGGTAISFGGYDDTLRLDPTAAFQGVVDGGGGNNTLELRAGAAGGTLDALGLGFVNFGHVLVDSGADWTIKVASPAAGQLITGSGGSSRLVFDTGGAIDLSGVSGFPTIALSGFSGNELALADANFIGLSSAVISVIGGNFGNTIDASAVTGPSRVMLNGGLRADSLVGGGGNDILMGFGGNDKLIGNAGNDTLNGGGGNDTLNGGAGNDTLNGGSGADKMAGGAGNDTYIVDNVGDVVTEATAAGTDTVKTALSSYTLGANVENLTYTGSGSFAGTGNSLANSITGGVGNDTLNGLGGNDTLTGGAGNDTLDGGAGADAMAGGGGNDTYIVGTIGDVVSEATAAGTDTVKTNLSSYTLGANVENLTYTGSGSFAGTGNTLNNIITGGAGNDTLNGGAGNDTLNGSGGNDILDGGLGNDTLKGGAGNDSFLFDTALSATTNVDHIFDFNSVSDHVRLGHSIFGAATGIGGGGLGTLKATLFFNTASGSETSSTRIIYNSSTGALSYDTDGSGGTAAIHFATLSTGLALTNSSFIVV